MSVLKENTKKDSVILFSAILNAEFCVPTSFGEANVDENIHARHFSFVLKSTGWLCNMETDEIRITKIVATVRIKSLLFIG